MKQAVVIGAGFAGLAAAWELLKKDYSVTIIEASSQPGGLASGFTNSKWEWSLEQHYHHLFESDHSILDLAREVDHQVDFKVSQSSTYLAGQTYQLDTPQSLLAFSPLSVVERLRVGLTLFYLRLTPFWKQLEKYPVDKFLVTTMSQKAWDVLWQPLMAKKFSLFAPQVSAVWFWARIKKRSKKLGYPEGGFQKLALKISDQIEKKGGLFVFNQLVINIHHKKEQLELITKDKKKIRADLVISTLPTNQTLALLPDLSVSFIKKFQGNQGIGAINLVLCLKEPFFTDGTYWLNVNDLKIPFLAIVEQSNFVDKKHYNQENIIYVGNYLESSSPLFKMEPAELLDYYLPFLIKINPNFKKSQIIKTWSFKANFAQPIMDVNYASRIPPFKLPVKGVYLANMQQVYPWDRGTNYAVEVGKKVAKLATHDMS